MEKLLVIEDSSFFRSIVEKEITSEPGIAVVTARSLAESLRAIEEHGDQLFLALVDLTLPDAPDGEAVAAIRAADIPCVVFTARYDDCLRARLMDEGVLDYLVKDSPASLRYLASIVRRVHRNRNITAVVADDSKTQRRHISDLLTLSRFNVLQAADGQEALEAVASDDTVRLVITDYSMPVMNGIDLIRSLRRDFDRDELAIIGLSASDNATLSAKFIKYGANDFLHKPFLPEEFFCRISQNMEMLEKSRELKEAATRDFLTGLPNRRCFFDTAGTLLAAVQRGGTHAVAALLDVDHFKQINDVHGHDNGDRVLSGIAEILDTSVRRDTDIAARIGGEEFAIFAYDMAQGAIEGFFDGIRQSIEAATFPASGGAIKVTVSIGVCDTPAVSIEEMLSAADTNLYRAKNAGRNQIIVG